MPAIPARGGADDFQLLVKLFPFGNFVATIDCALLRA
jgi:hypothetical protein